MSFLSYPASDPRDLDTEVATLRAELQRANETLRVLGLPHCSQCGQSFGRPACGPTHAMLANERAQACPSLGELQRVEGELATARIVRRDFEALQATTTIATLRALLTDEKQWTGEQEYGRTWFIAAAELAGRLFDAECARDRERERAERLDLEAAEQYAAGFLDGQKEYLLRAECAVKRGLDLPPAIGFNDPRRTPAALRGDERTANATTTNSGGD